MDLSRRGLFSLPLALPFAFMAKPAAAAEARPEENLQFWVSRDKWSFDTSLFQYHLYRVLKETRSHEDTMEIMEAWFPAVAIGRMSEITLYFPVKFLRNWVKSHYDAECREACKRAFGEAPVEYELSPWEEYKRHRDLASVRRREELVQLMQEL